MKSTALFIFLLLHVSFTGFAQSKLFTKNGIISFYSKAPVEDIEATNNKVLAIVDLEKNTIEFSVLIKGFEFEKGLMQEHFNENYLESDKYPKAYFKGVFEGSIPGILSAGNKTYTLSINGHLSLHGVTQPLKTPGVITVKDKLIKASSSFTIRLSDFKIKIPTLVANNISKEILIKVNIPSFTEMN